MTLGFGCVNLGSARSGGSARAAGRLVGEALDLGVRVFDTADAYGDGASERVLGQALGTRRDDAFIATKGGYVFRERSALEQRARRTVGAVLRRTEHRRRASSTGPAAHRGGSYGSQDLTPRHLRAAVESSLRRLRTDRIDRYQLHGPHEVIPDLLAELVDLRDAGKVVSFGIGAEDVGVAVGWLGVPEVDAVQVPFGVLDPEAADELFPRLEARRADVWARGVLGGGLLALAARDPQALADDPKAPVVAALRALAATTRLEIDELALAYVRSFAEVSTVLVGIASGEHLRRNVGLFGAPLDPEVVASVRALVTSEARRGRA